MTEAPTYCLYRHIRPDTNQVFYVGQGKDGANRPWSKHNRNIYWKRVVRKNNGQYKVQVLLEGLSIEQINEKEIEFISLYGKRIESGTLVNLQDGGNAHGGYLMREETKNRMKESHKGNQATKGYIRINNGGSIKAIPSNQPIPEGWMRGELKRGKMSKETCTKMSLAKKGRDMGFTTEQRQAWSKGNKSAAGFMWICNNIEAKLIKATNLIPEGWVKGRVFGGKFIKK